MLNSRKYIDFLTAIRRPWRKEVQKDHPQKCEPQLVAGAGRAGLNRQRRIQREKGGEENLKRGVL